MYASIDNTAVAIARLPVPGSSVVMVINLHSGPPLCAEVKFT